MALYVRVSWPFLRADWSLMWLNIALDRSLEQSVFKTYWLQDPFSEGRARWLLTAKESFQVGDWNGLGAGENYLEAKAHSKRVISFYWWSLNYDLSFLAWSGSQAQHAVRRLFAHTSYYGLMVFDVPSQYRKSSKARHKYLKHELELARLVAWNRRVEFFLRGFLLS